jgi:YVTN family beta-propeller protein
VVHTFSVGGGQLTRTGDIQIGTLAQNPFPMGVSVSPDGKLLAVANNLANTLDLVDLTSRRITATIPVGGYPYGALFSRDGRRVYVSHSRDWATTAIFVIEDDAQNGPDHVDAHRTQALVISPTPSGRLPSWTTRSTTPRPCCGPWS